MTNGRLAVANMELRTSPTPDRKHVNIELWMDGKPLGHIHLSGGESEQFCHLVANARQALTDKVSETLPTNGPHAATFKPHCNVVAEHSQSRLGIVMALRHPGLGWIPFLLPRTQATELAQLLVDFSKSQPSHTTPQ